MYRDVHHLKALQREALLLKALDDFANQAALDTVRLDHDEAALIGGHICKLRADFRREKVADII